MGGQQAAGVLLTIKMDQLAREGASMSEEEQEAFQRPLLEQYDEEGNPYYSTARIWDDVINDPAETRTVLGLGIAAAINAPFPEPARGVFRM